MTEAAIGILTAIYCRLQWEKHLTEARVLRRHLDPKYVEAVIRQRGQLALLHCATAILAVVTAVYLTQFVAVFWALSLPTN